MKRVLLSLALSTGALPAIAANCAVPNGSIAVVYVNEAGSCVYQPYATISDATFASFIAWCKAHYASSAGASTSAGCFNTWANDGMTQTISGMTAAAQATAAAAAAAAVTPPAIVPAQ